MDRARSRRGANVDFGDADEAIGGSGGSRRLCVPEIRFCNIGNDFRQGQAVI